MHLPLFRGRRHQFNSFSSFHFWSCHPCCISASTGSPQSLTLCPCPPTSTLFLLGPYIIYISTVYNRQPPHLSANADSSSRHPFLQFFYPPFVLSHYVQFLPNLPFLLLTYLSPPASSFSHYFFRILL